MRVFDYLKKAGSWPIVNPDHACNPECTSLEDLFTQTLSDYQQRSRLLSGLAHSRFIWVFSFCAIPGTAIKNILINREGVTGARQRILRITTR